MWDAISGLLELGGVLVGVLLIARWVKSKTKPSAPAKSLEERSDAIIQKFWSSIRDDSFSHYLDNQVRDCLREIAAAERRPQFGPKRGEYLYNWDKRRDVPADYRALRARLMQIFQARFHEIKDIKREEEMALHAQQARSAQLLAAETARRWEEALAKLGRELYEQNIDLIQKFLEITERKVSILDDYGDENWGVLDKEIETCLAKISQQNNVRVDWREHNADLRGGGDGRLPHEYTWLRKSLGTLFREYHEAQRRSPSLIDVNGLGGKDFETHVARRLKECGYDDVRGTPVTGDQGADLIAKKNGRTIIIQAKRYQGTVGNKAVQEVASAVSFYGGDEGSRHPRGR